MDEVAEAGTEMSCTKPRFFYPDLPCLLPDGHIGPCHVPGNTPSAVVASPEPVPYDGNAETHGHTGPEYARVALPSSVQLDHLEEICALYDKAFGDYPEHAHEGDYVFRFIKAVVAAESVGEIDYADPDATMNIMRSIANSLFYE